MPIPPTVSQVVRLKRYLFKRLGHLPKEALGDLGHSREENAASIKWSSECVSVTRSHRAVCVCVHMYTSSL